MSEAEIMDRLAALEATVDAQAIKIEGLKAEVAELRGGATSPDVVVPGGMPEVGDAPAVPLALVMPPELADEIHAVFGVALPMTAAQLADLQSRLPSIPNGYQRKAQSMVFAVPLTYDDHVLREYVGRWGWKVDVHGTKTQSTLLHVTYAWSNVLGVFPKPDLYKGQHGKAEKAVAAHLMTSGTVKVPGVETLNPSETLQESYQPPQCSNLTDLFNQNKGTSGVVPG